MKRFYASTLFVLIFMLATVMNSYATGRGIKLLFSLTTANKARIGAVNPGDKKMTLTISTSNGTDFFTKEINKGNHYFEVLDLNGLRDGVYYVSLDGYGETQKKKFEKSGKDVFVIEERKLQEPVFMEMEDNVLAISFINSTTNTINIMFEQNNRVVFQETGINSFAFSKRYSLNKLPKGKYTVKLNTGPHTFSYPLTVK